MQISLCKLCYCECLHVIFYHNLRSTKRTHTYYKHTAQSRKFLKITLRMKNSKVVLYIDCLRRREIKKTTLVAVFICFLTLEGPFCYRK